MILVFKSNKLKIDEFKYNNTNINRHGDEEEELKTRRRTRRRRRKIKNTHLWALGSPYLRVAWRLCGECQYERRLQREVRR